MAQTVYAVYAEDNLYPEVFTYNPESDMEDIIDWMIDEGNISTSENGYDTEVFWYTLGEGESDTDEILSDELILKLFEEEKFEKYLDENDIPFELVQTSSSHIYLDRESE